MYAQKETCGEEVNVENLVTKRLRKLVLGDEFAGKNSPNSPQLKLIWGTTLYHVDDIPFTSSSIPDVYTQFRKASF